VEGRGEGGDQHQDDEREGDAQATHPSLCMNDEKFEYRTIPYGTYHSVIPLIF
jgi:hypothetical protein